MGAANYSSYNRPSRTALKKKAPAPRLINPTPAPKLAFSTVGKPSAGSGLLKKSKVAPAVPAGPVMPVAPTLQAVPTVTAAPVGPPPQTLQSGSDRISIHENYGQGVNDVNRGIYDAALAYGGVDNVDQFGFDATGGDNTANIAVTHNPADNSALSVIGRNSTAVNKNIDESAGAQNTFFSSNRLNDLQTANSDADRQRAAAKKQYDDAVGTYISNLLGLRTDRDTGLRNADIADISAAAANAPLPEQATAPPEAAPAAANPMANTLAQQAIHNVPFHPVAGTDSNGNPGVWHIYPDGHRVFVRN